MSNTGKVAKAICGMKYAEFVNFVAELKNCVDANVAKDPDERWRSAIFY